MVNGAVVVVVVEVVVVEVVVVDVVVVDDVVVDVDINGVVDVDVAVSLIVDVVRCVGVEIVVAVYELSLSVETEAASLIVTNGEIFVNAIEVLKVVMVVSKEDSDSTVAKIREFDVLIIFEDPSPWFKISTEDDEDKAFLVRLGVNFMSNVYGNLHTVILRWN
jgi:hypothetical protein